MPIDFARRAMRYAGRRIGVTRRANAASSAASVPFARLGRIDSPTDGEALSDSPVLVSGWVDVAGVGPHPSVVLRVDGAPFAAAPVCDDRPDVAAAEGRADLERAGFHVTVDIRPFQTDEPRRVRLDAVLAGDLDVAFAARDLELGPTRNSITVGYITAPVDGDRLNRDEVGIYGWGVVDGLPGRMAEIFVNGRYIESVAIGDSRPDVAEYLADAAVTDCGFEVSVDLTAPRFAHEPFPDASSIAVVVTPSMPDGRTLALGPVPVELFSPEPPRVPGFIERPVAGERLTREFHTVYGWACSEEVSVDSIEVLIDGESVGLARIGLDRLDLAEISDAPESVTSGFELLVDFSSVATDQRRVILEVVANLADGSREVVARQSHELVAAKERFQSTIERERSASRVELVRARADRLLQLLPRPQTGTLNLLAVSHDLGYGGGQLWLSELLERAGAGRAFDCTVVAPKDGPLRKDMEALGIKVHVDSAIPVNDFEAYEGRVGELALWSRAMGHNAALVNTVACFGGADMAVRLGLPYVWAIHESWTPEAYWHVVFPPDYLNRDVRARAEWALGQANAVIFEAEATRQQYLGHIAPDRARVVPYGVRVAAIDRFMAESPRDVVRARLGFKPDDRIVLLMGTIEPRKAQSLVTQAFARAITDHPDAKLMLVGDLKTRYSEAVRELADRLGVADRVRIMPVVRDTYSWYRAADLLVCASDIESLPRSVLEAMCFGVPIVATSVFGLSELLADGENGFLFEPRSVRRAAAALHHVLSLHPDELRQIGESGRATVRNHYDSLGYATEIMAMLTEAIDVTA